MVLIPRAAPVQTPASANNERLGPPTRIASYTGNSVEELPQGASVSFESAAYGFQQDAPSFFDHNRGSHDQHTSRQNTVGINAPSQTFAAMLEFPEAAGGRNENAAGDGSAAPLAGVVARAIEIYETNAKIVSGESNILGTSVSLVL